MRRRWIFIGAALIAGGLVTVTSEESHHNACTSGLGPFGSLTGGVAHNCGVANTVFLLGIVGAILGLALVVAALLIRS